MLSKLFLSIILILSLSHMAKTAHECSSSCMQCIERYDRGYCTMCYMAKNHEGRCEDKHTDENCVEFNPVDQCLKCKDGYSLKVNGPDRYCVESKETEDEHCLFYELFAGRWQCDICKGMVPEVFSGKCEKWDTDKDYFKHCMDGIRTREGRYGCIICENGYALHWNSHDRYHHPYCVQWDGDRQKGCRDWDIAYDYCSVCDVKQGYYKKYPDEHGCQKVPSKVVE